MMSRNRRKVEWPGMGREDMKEMDLTLLIMAAGIGSSFGGGIKQLEPVDARGHIIMDYSIYDAMEAGFNKVVFVIRKDLLADFDAVIGQRMKNKGIQIEYAFQEIDDVPEKYKAKTINRTKPWELDKLLLQRRKRLMSRLWLSMLTITTVKKDL